ncbi:hypothetical protein [Crossiella sp. CA198]|uniref:hypothetical protein n=1 Tax=Crossiella sp. CA198 TaxID=3455607 RepID=UPI003F8D435B
MTGSTSERKAQQTERDNECVRLYRQNQLSPKEMASQVGVSLNTFYEALKRMGEPTRRRLAPHLKGTQRIAAAAICLHLNEVHGHGPNAIGRLVGRSHTVAGVLIKLAKNLSAGQLDTATRECPDPFDIEHTAPEQAAIGHASRCGCTKARP